MRVALLFDHFGPYHIARLSAAGKFSDIQAVEFYSKSSTYAWNRCDLPETGWHQIFKTVDRSTVAFSEFREVLWRTLDSLNPDVVAIPGWGTKESLAALQWCLRNQIPSVLMSESTAHDEPRRLLKETLKRRIVSLSSAGLVGGSSHLSYLRALGMAESRIFLGYDAVDNDYFVRGVLTSSIEAGESATVPSFLASARFVTKKNLPRLIQAFARYRNLCLEGDGSQDPWNLILLGDGAIRDQLEKLVFSLGLQAFVKLPGFKQYGELPQYYKSASTFIHASTSEQWGLVVNEAMACGLPVLVSNRCGCAPDLVQEGVNGFIFDPWNIEEIANKMKMISSKSVLTLHEMGQASRDIIANCGPERFADGLLNAAEAAVRHGPRHGWYLDYLLLGGLTKLQ
ncbi:glycosyltransferase involved in cell wall biosynthesis [Prosthecobacter fusiformis]|uniref:Glycosyltransferase involved in cell wall biosynthesis n=1 Tax=Prosthecobacter fusiformis TaxID=48464 RepID=A0A4V3FE66_9BACT|nr:glycosyltransferase [Prosthecobacter fusiformis]TDU64640.1 glycosyltransferase involved in cell wall biosynthesis [Prosthecobacter fusiformis]